MIVTSELVRDLRGEFTPLVDDLRARSESDPTSSARLGEEHRRATELGRTAQSFTEWRESQLTQGAAAWLLGCAFVRFCEDNRLVAPVWLAGPPDRRHEALDRQNEYFQRHPRENERDWLLEAFRYFRDLPATAAIFDLRNPLWALQPSADAAGRVIRFWRSADETGALLRDFSDPALDTRFLGDLYQNLSERARDEYALFQTPDFVANFILDRTLERAIKERGLEGLKLIDPACGSGHFLLDAFVKLLDHWHRTAPGMDARERVQTALDSLHGVDINPFAVAIAQFRLTVAALRAGSDPNLDRAPAYRHHLAAGDSLLFGTRQLTFDERRDGAQDADAILSGFTYSAEDQQALHRLLTPGRYDVVVANPPYITPKDAALNAAYRKRYETCSGKYQLTVPFTERLFQLAAPRAWIGQIVGNAFMKREFGRKLIEKFLVRKDLREIIDTSGTYIPGHGTPTLIMIARNRPPSPGPVRAVLGIRGEPSTPADPANGLVWNAILETVDQPGLPSAFVSSVDVARQGFDHFPWSLSGGGALELRRAVEGVGRQSTLASRVESIGFGLITGDDAVFASEGGGSAPKSWTRDRLPTRAFVEGERVRDWLIDDPAMAAFPYDAEHRPIQALQNSETFWPFRTTLRAGLAFGKTRGDRGLPWFEFILPSWARIDSDRLITYAEIATHNHFVLDRGGKLFIQSAPVIKLPDEATEDEYFRVLGLLNSSTACFWLKQVSYNKGAGGGARVDQGFAPLGAESWENHYDFTGTKLKEFPLPAAAPLDLSARLDRAAQELARWTPRAVTAEETPSRQRLEDARGHWHHVRQEMIGLQEELDWSVYRLYGLLDEELTITPESLPLVDLGERAFEIVLARRVAAGDEETAWFERHGSTPTTEIPAHWPQAYRDLVARQIEVIESHPDVALIERPECKRRWATESWEEMESEALRDWLLNRLENPSLWQDRDRRPTTRSAVQLAEVVGRDDDFRGVLDLYVGGRDYDLASQLANLLADQVVPFLASYRYRDSGLRKRSAWEEAWALQRREDAGEQVGTIPVPPKYVTADFARTSYWQQRGKLDVPKERFISYPGAEREGSGSPVFGWAGWDHLQQAVALASLIIAREQVDGWPKERLTPLLAGLQELQPWLAQWHHDPVPEYGGPPCVFLAAQLDRWLGAYALTQDELQAWRPTAAPPRAGRGLRRSREVSAT